MRTFLRMMFVLLGAAAFGGQPTWNPGTAPPSLTLALGDGPVKTTCPLPSGATQLDLVLKRWMADEPEVVLTWKTEGQLWLRQTKKMPGDSVPLRVDLPPGRQITLEITTGSGTPLAVIKLPRK